MRLQEVESIQMIFEIALKEQMEIEMEEGSKKIKRIRHLRG